MVTVFQDQNEKRNKESDGCYCKLYEEKSEERMIQCLKCRD